MPHRSRSRALRVAIGPHEVAGYYRTLASALEGEGFEVSLITLISHSFGFEPAGGRSVRAAAWARTMNALRRRARSGIGRVALGPILAAELALRAIAFVQAVATHDVFVYGFAGSYLAPHPALLPLFRAELLLLRVLRKRTICVFNGSDSRPPYLDGLTPPEVLHDPAALARATRFHKRRVRLINRYATVVMDSPLAAHFHERPFVSTLEFGIGCRPRPAAPLATPRERVRVVHAPSNLRVKGTVEIRAAVEELRASGLDFDYVELSGLPNEAVLEALRQADIAVDQLYSDTRMAQFAAEAAQCGTPVVVGGYADAELARQLDPDSRPPSCFCEPEALVPTLRRLITTPAERERIRRQQLEFVSTRWSEQEFGRRWALVITGDIPAAWYRDPADVRYVCGVGLRRDESAAAIAALVASEGAAALQVTDKPALQALLVARAAGDRTQRQEGAA